MRIGLISDSHGRLEPVRAALALFAERQVDRIVHCGDIDVPQVVEQFQGWPVDFVFGNMDFHRDLLAEAIDRVGGGCHGEFGAAEWAGRQVAFLHGHDPVTLHEALYSGEWDVVFRGHTHQPEVQHVGSTLVVNPGALYQARTLTVAVVDLQSLDVEHLPVD